MKIGKRNQEKEANIKDKQRKSNMQTIGVPEEENQSKKTE